MNAQTGDSTTTVATSGSWFRAPNGRLIPPLAGGSDLAPEHTPPAPPEGEPAAAEPTQPTVAEATLELPFTLEEIGDDFRLEGPQARQFLTARQAQMQGVLTKKTQELAQLQEKLGQRVELFDRLDNEDTKRDALNELLEPFGYRIPEDAPADAANAESTELPEEPGDEDPQIAELREQLAALQERNATQDQQDAQERFDTHVVESLDKLATTLGYTKAEDVPEAARNAVLARAMALPRLTGDQDGLMNFDQAIADEIAYREQLEKAHREAFLESKKVPGLVTANAGVPAQPAVDLSDPATRRQHALAIAGRRF